MPRGSPGLPTDFAEQVLDLVARIPAGRVMSYGDVAEALCSTGARAGGARAGGQRAGGARAVGGVLARWGNSVPWQRVVRADGRAATGHEPDALRRLRLEGTAMTGPDRVDMAVARWRPGQP